MAGEWLFNTEFELVPDLKCSRFSQIYLVHVLYINVRLNKIECVFFVCVIFLTMLLV